MRFPRVPHGGRQPVALPLLVWLVLTVTGAGLLLMQQQNARDAVAQRFELRVGLMGDFVTSYAADLIDRERVQAIASLADPHIDARDFERAVAGFGYPAAVLLDDEGRVMQVVPRDPALIGKDLTGDYAHLRIAAEQGHPAVSPVVLSAARGQPVVAFAVPFRATTGRRVFSGAVAIRNSPLSSYLTSAMSLSDARVQLTDSSGAVVAANRALGPAMPTLADDDAELASALTGDRHGRYRSGGQWWRYASTAIPDTPWRLSAAVPEDVLFDSLDDNEIAGRVALCGAAAVGLLVVAVVGRARRSRLDLRHSEQRFRKVFDGSRIGMALTDRHGRLLRVNPAACQLLGRAEWELVGRHWAEFTEPDVVADGHLRVGECLAGRIDGFDMEARYRHADGHLIEASVTTTLLRDQDDRPQYFATQIVDTTGRKALERARLRDQAELAERAEQLQQANAHLGDVMAMLSHDVRQPLTSIVGLGELLLEEWEESTDQSKHDDVRRMTAAGHRANILVTDILTLAQLDAGALVARPVRVDISHVVREAAAAHQAVEGTRITVVAPDETIGLTDPAHLQLILGNLLANATKYGEPPVTVTVSNDPDHVRIRVSDGGEGVPAEFVPQLFDRFTRAGSGVATTTAGTGLGLYLVRQLARAGGMDVVYQPNSPRGASFIVSLPRTKGDFSGVFGGRPLRSPVASQ